MDITQLQSDFENIQKKVSHVFIQSNAKEMRNNEMCIQENKKIVSLLESGNMPSFALLDFSWKSSYYDFSVEQSNKQPYLFQEDLRDFMKSILPRDLLVHHLFSETKSKLIQYFHKTLDKSKLGECFFQPFIPYTKRLSTIFEGGDDRLLTKEEELFLIEQYKNFFKAAFSLFFDSETRFDSSLETMCISSFEIEIRLREHVNLFFHHSNMSEYFGTSLAQDLQKKLRKRILPVYEEILKTIIPTDKAAHVTYDYLLFILKETGYLFNQNDKINIIHRLKEHFELSKSSIERLIEPNTILNPTQISFIKKEESKMQEILSFLLTYTEKEGL